MAFESALAFFWASVILGAAAKSPAAESPAVESPAAESLGGVPAIPVESVPDAPPAVRLAALSAALLESVGGRLPEAPARAVSPAAPPFTPIRWRFRIKPL